jgi:hypothetical protein
MARLSIEDTWRARTWAKEMAAAALPEGTPQSIDGPDIRFHGQGGLLIHARKGCWYSHAKSCGGWSTVQMIQVIRGCSPNEATDWVLAWLTAHPGTGSCAEASPDDGDDDDDRSIAKEHANAARFQEVLHGAVGWEGTSVVPYLTSRALPSPYPDNLRYLPNARMGEGAMVAVLEAHGTTIGVQITYLDAAGRKSMVNPVRETFTLERERGKAGVFILSAIDAQHEQEPARLAEGVEDALSLRQAGCRGLIIGVLGAGRFKHIEVLRGRRYTLLKDGDAPGSPATKGLVEGVDHILLAGADLAVTATPVGEDANSILQGNDGAAKLLALIEQAEAAELSLSGQVTRLCRLDAPEYDHERTAIAKKYRIRVATLDDLVQTARLKSSPAEGASPKDEDAPWGGAVVLCGVLDAALAEVRRYIIAPDMHLGTIVVWSALTHVTHNEHVRLQKSPRLAVLSRVPGSGKTTCLDIVCSLSLRGTMASSFTASSVLRGMDSDKPTLLLDEVDGVVWSTNSELGSILKAGDRRRSAIVKRSVPTPDGGWEVRDFCVWGTVAFAGINELPQPIQERSLCIWLERALGGDALEHLQDGTSLRLIELRRQLRAWGEQLIELPDSDLPEILRRQPARLSDNWRPIMAVAQLAGGQWPALITEAINAAVIEEQRPNMVMRLLRSILRAFNAQAEKDAAAIKLAVVNPMVRKSYNDLADNVLRLTTPTLIRHLLTEEEEEWATANRGRVITPYYLRHQLRHLLRPKGAMDWWTGPAGNQKHHSGYTRDQFKVAWATILPGEVGEDEIVAPLHTYPQGSGVSGVSGADGANPRSGTPDTSDDDKPEGNSSGGENHPNRRAAPVTPDTPDDPERVNREGRATAHEPARPNGAGAQPDDVADNTPPAAQKPPSAAVRAVRDLRVEHPDWSTARLARSLGVAEAKVVRALRGWEPPPSPPASSAEAP